LSDWGLGLKIGSKPAREIDVPYSPRACCALSAAIVSLSMAGLPSADAVLGAQSDGDAKKPSLSLRVTPPVGFAPLRTRLVVDVRGGDDDYADFYCPTIEWDWGDGTISANSEDCDPYEAGKSSIRRRFSTEHTFRQAGAYRVAFRLKQKDRVVGTSSVNVQVRAGLPQF
jgi:hypothetical protein